MQLEEETLARLVVVRIHGEMKYVDKEGELWWVPIVVCAAVFFGKYHNVDWFNDTFVYRNKKHIYEEVYPAYMIISLIGYRL